MSDHKTQEMTHREEEILKSTIEDFISSNIPVGSKFLKKKHNYPFSSATIRSVLSNLEKQGFLTHPHVSSGRIPTETGYRIYVNELMDPAQTLPVAEKSMHKLENLTNNVEDVMEATALMLGKISRLFGIVVINRYEESILSDIELMRLGHDRIMVVLALKSGFVRSIVLNLKVDIKTTTLDLIGQILKDRLVGLSLDEIQTSIDNRLKDTEVSEHEIVQVLMKDKQGYFSVEGNSLVYTSTHDGLLSQPEFHETDSLQKLLPALEESYMAQFFSSNIMINIPQTFIGTELQDDILLDCALVTTPFEGRDVKGRLAILGPTRLPYQEITDLLQSFSMVIPNAC